MDNDDNRKAFHFDLDEEKLKAHYPSDSTTGYKRAWSNICSFLESNSFKHTQYSGYESVDILSYYEAYFVFKSLQEKYPWFIECAQVATVTEIGTHYDILKYLFQEIENPVPENKRNKWNKWNTSLPEE